MQKRQMPATACFGTVSKSPPRQQGGPKSALINIGKKSPAYNDWLAKSVSHSRRNTTAEPSGHQNEYLVPTEKFIFRLFIKWLCCSGINERLK